MATVAKLDRGEEAAMREMPELSPEIAAQSKALGDYHSQWVKRQIAAGNVGLDPDDDPEYWRGAQEIISRYPVN